MTRAPATCRPSSCEGSILSISARAAASSSSTVRGHLLAGSLRLYAAPPDGLDAATRVVSPEADQHTIARATSPSAVMSYCVMNVRAGL